MKEEVSMKRRAACFAIAGTMFLSVFAATTTISSGAEATPGDAEAATQESQQTVTSSEQDNISLKAPKKAQAKVMKLKTIQIHWTKVKHAEGYEIFRAAKKDGHYKKIATVKGHNKTSYKDTDRTVGEMYYYRVRAYAGESYGPYSKKVHEKAAPAKTTAKLKAGEEQIKISWEKADSAQGYHIYRATSKKGEYVRIAKLKGKDVTTFTNLNLKGGKKYYYRVRGYHMVKGKKILARHSDTVGVKAKKVKLKTHKKGFQYKNKFTVKAYAYTGGGTTASGTKARVGAIAVSPSVIPLGTSVYVEGYGFAKAEDTGGNIKGRTIDLYFNSVGACYQWGVRHKTIYTGVKR